MDHNITIRGNKLFECEFHLVRFHIILRAVEKSARAIGALIQSNNTKGMLNIAYYGKQTVLEMEKRQSSREPLTTAIAIIQIRDWRLVKTVSLIPTK